MIILIGIWISRKTKSGDDLFLGGRSLTWGVIGLSLFASNISSTTIVGLTGAAYSSGIVQSVYEWISRIPLIIAALIFVPLYLNSKLLQSLSFWQKDLTEGTSFFSVITIITSILIETAGGLYAGAIVLKTFIPNLVIWQTTLVLALFAGIYTAYGGLKAVVYTDSLQAIILIFGGIVLTYILFEKIDFSLETMIASAPEGHFSIYRPINDKTLPWPGLFLGVPLLGFWYWSTNQYIVQRVLGAKDIKNARWGVLLGGFLKLIPLFIMVIPGAMAISIYSGIENPDMVYPTIVLNALPKGLIGLVLAGLISAIMSSVDSTLNSSSTLVVVDFIKPKISNISSNDIVKYGRWSTFILMIIAAIWAPMIQYFGGYMGLLATNVCYFCPTHSCPFFGWVFDKKGNANGAYLTLILGTILGIIIFILQQFGIWNIHFTINAGIVVALSAIVFILSSRMFAPPANEIIENFTFQKRLLDQDNDVNYWYQNYKMWSGLLLLLIILIFIILFK